MASGRLRVWAIVVRGWPWGWWARYWRMGCCWGNEGGGLLPDSGEVVAAFAVEFGVLDDRGEVF